MSTLITSSVAPNSSTVDYFKAWIRMIPDALTSLGGWEQTSDTGQFDPDTIASVPTYPDTVYQIWRTTDSLASSSPIYMKLEFGTNTTSGTMCYISLGTGSDGSGNLTGNTSNRIQWQGYNSNTTLTYPFWICKLDGVLAVIACVGGSAYCGAFIIERSRDTTGAISSDYFTLVCLRSTTRNVQTVFKTGGSVNATSVMTVLPVVGCNYSTGAIGTTCFVSPLFPLVGKIDNPMIGAMSCRSADVSEGVTFGVTIYGTSRTYRPLVGEDIAEAFGAATSGNALCIIWE